MASKKNENRKTTAKGFIANPYTKTFDEFEERIDYTRSLTKAIALVRKEKALDADVMISVTELIQDEVKRIVYNSELVFENMVSDYENEEDANSYVFDNQTVIQYTMYEYSAHVWMKNGKEYTSEYVLDNSPLKLGKIDTRAFIRMSAEKLFDCNCIAVNGEERTEVKRFAIVDNDKLKLCVKES